MCRSRVEGASAGGWLAVVCQISVLSSVSATSCKPGKRSGIEASLLLGFVFVRVFRRSSCVEELFVRVCFFSMLIPGKNGWNFFLSISFFKLHGFSLSISLGLSSLGWVYLSGRKGREGKDKPLEGHAEEGLMELFLPEISCRQVLRARRHAHVQREKKLAEQHRVHVCVWTHMVHTKDWESVLRKEERERSTFPGFSGKSLPTSASSDRVLFCPLFPRAPALLLPPPRRPSGSSLCRCFRAIFLSFLPVFLFLFLFFSGPAGRSVSSSSTEACGGSSVWPWAS